MDANVIRNWGEIENGEAWQLFAFLARIDLRKQMMYDGMQIVCGAALATYTWKLNFHPMTPFVFSAIGAAGVAGFCVNIRKYFQNFPRLQIGGIGSKWYLTTGTLTYFANIYALSEALKRGNTIWLACAGIATFGYCLAVSSLNSLGIVWNMKLLLRCGQLMFGPTLIACAGYYLLRFQQHDENWLFWLMWYASSDVGNNISFTGSKRLEIDGPNWLLFKGIELLLGGYILCASGAVLVIHSLDNKYNPIITCFHIMTFLTGIADISNSIEVLSSLSRGRIFRCNGRVGVRNKMTSYGYLATLYAAFYFGWRRSLVLMPLIPIGMFATHRSFRSNVQFGDKALDVASIQHASY